MQNTTLTTLLVAAMIVLSSCGSPSESINTTELLWTDLIDEDLSRWDQYLSFKHKLGYDGSPPTNENGDTIQPIGMNPTGYNAFATQREGEDLVIRVDGEYYGALISKSEYEDYHFQLKFKWGEKMDTAKKSIERFRHPLSFNR